MKSKDNFQEKLKQLEAITAWFDSPPGGEAGGAFDLEEGLKKVKEGVALVKEIKKRLSKVENEFEEVKKTM